MVRVIQWEGCYDGSLKGLLTQESMHHPAKFARNLIERIYQHGEEMGYWKPGDLVVDPFGGVASGGIVGALRGYYWIGIELEHRFVGMAEANIELHAKYFKEKGLPEPIIIQGDSRYLRDIIDVAFKAVVTSPPFAGNSGGTGEKSSGPMNEQNPGIFERHLGSMNNDAAYGNTPGQINSLPQGSITSPPFGGITADGGWQMLGKYAQEGRLTVGQVNGDKNKVYPSWKQERKTDYAIDPKNIGKLDASVTSPPYSELRLDSGPWKDGKGPRFEEYGEQDGQMGNLADGSITSPPFGERLAYPDVERGQKVQDKLGKGGTLHQSPGEAEGQLAQLDSSVEAQNDPVLDNGSEEETYWTAVAQVYAGVFNSLRPGGVLAVVLKNYVKNREVVPFCETTAKVLEGIGFEILDEVHAMMVKEIPTPVDMFSGESSRKVSRKSFFRRLAEKKGAPPIDWETVLFCKKLA